MGRAAELKRFERGTAGSLSQCCPNLQIRWPPPTPRPPFDSVGSSGRAARTIRLGRDEASLPAPRLVEGAGLGPFGGRACPPAGSQGSAGLGGPVHDGNARRKNQGLDV